MTGTTAAPSWTEDAGALAGAQGRAREITGRAAGFDPAAQALRAMWLVWAPDFCPFWDHYTVSVCHLRPIAEDPAPIIHLPGATHEVVLLAADGGVLQDDPPPDPADPATIRPLTPPNLIGQFVAPDDAQAAALCADLARACCDGGIILEPDGIRGARAANAATFGALVRARLGEGAPCLLVR